MASAPKATNLPIFYNDLVPLNKQEHLKWSVKGLDDAKFMQGHHAIPLTAEEFIQAQRHYPIIFSEGDNPVPLALMGLNEGVNIFLGDDNKIEKPIYIPAYVRRYPFMLARLRPDAQELSLCFDPSSSALGEFKDGEKLFDGDEPSENTQRILKFCEDFERAVQNTGAFMNELKQADLLMDGEVAITADGNPQPYLYRGFKMINEEKLRELRGDELRKFNQNGMLPLMFAHLTSLQMMRDIFAEQVRGGKMPQVSEAPKIDSAQIS